MGIDPPFIYDQPSRYTRVNSSEKAFEPKAISQTSWTQQPTRPKQATPHISAEDLNRHPDSYMIIPYGNLDRTALPKNTKGVVKWSRIVLLVLRICSWIGAAGLLVCVVCIRPIGSTMDWVMRIPPGAALMHTTYAIYHLSRSAKSRTPTSSGSYMIFGSILDSCLIPFQVLLAILARNQLLEALSDGTQKWETILETTQQRYTIIYSTYLLGITTAGLHFVGLCLSLFLAMKFRQISQLPPDMNPLEDNLTARGHRKAKTSVATFMTDNSGQSSPLIDERSQTIPWAHTRTDSGSAISTPRRRDDHAAAAQLHTDQNWYQQRSPPRVSQVAVANPAVSLASDWPDISQASQAEYSTVRDNQNWATHPSAESKSYTRPPPELQHLRSTQIEDEKLRPAPLSTRSKYDFSNRSPRPLGLHPPTPRETTPASGQGFDVRALRNIDGNSSAKKKVSASVWNDIKHELDSVGSASFPKADKKHYGEVVGMGRATRNQARVISSGVDDIANQGHVRMRDVSGKIAEEGRGGRVYTDF